jgi:methyl-accepting chemotaxis protein
LVDDLGRFVYGLADRSGLLYDPDPQTYLLMDISVSRLIAWRDQIGRLRSAGATLLNNGDMDASSVAKVEVMVADLTRSSADLRYTQNIVAALGFQDETSGTAQAAADAFIKLCRETFKYGEPAGNPEAFYAIGTQAINTIGEYHKAVNRTMRARLTDREATIERNLAFLAMVSVLALVALVYLMLSFNISFLADLKQVLRFMQETANGNMRHKARIAGSDELSDMSRSMDVMVNNISVMVATVRSNAALVANSGDALVRGSQSLSDRTVQQAANLEQTSASVQELASAVRENALAAQQSDHAAQGVREVAERGAQGMNQAIQSVEAIEASTSKMDEIVGVIDGLAFQTNILALNAAVEAARAGESGRGFAVVASEVRSLAQRSAESAKEIRKLITASSTQVATGVAQIRTAGQNITAIAAGVRGVAENLSQISTSSAEQSENLLEITGSIRQLDEITQHNGAMVEESVSQATALQAPPCSSYCKARQTRPGNWWSKR